ncbi:MAG: tetratricopeptide repeat protein [Alphaproteobacteria bacterium]
MFRIFIYLLSLSLLIANTANAEEPPKASDLEIRLGQLEYQTQQLTGKIEMLEHELRIFKENKKQNAQDHEYRLNALEIKGGLVTPASSVKAPLKKETTPQALKEEPKPLQLIELHEDNIMYYDKALLFFQEKKYDEAIEEFLSFLIREPSHEKSSHAQFLLGESYLKMEDPTNAAINFVQLYESFPDAKEAPEALLRLSNALFILEKKNEGCSTLGILLKNYPTARTSVRTLATETQKKNECP